MGVLDPDRAYAGHEAGLARWPDPHGDFATADGGFVDEFEAGTFDGRANGLRRWRVFFRRVDDEPGFAGGVGDHPREAAHGAGFEVVAFGPPEDARGRMGGEEVADEGGPRLHRAGFGEDRIGRGDEKDAAIRGGEAEVGEGAHGSRLKDRGLRT